MTRRSIVAAISIFVHAIVLTLLLTADLRRPISEWPSPRSAIAFIEERPRPVELPTITRRPLRSRAAGDSAANITPRPIELPPIAPPASLITETGREGILSLDLPAPIGSNPGAPDPGEPGTITSPPPPSVPQAPVRLHSGIRAPQRIVNVTPAYPQVARTAHVEGVVIIEATIDDRGSVIRAQVLRSIPLLDDAALAAVRQWKFSPTLLNGVAVPIVMTVTVNFRLN